MKKHAPKILVGLNVLTLFVGISMLLAALMFKRVTENPSKAPEVVERFTSSMSDNVGQSYSQEMHDQMSGLLENTVSVVNKGEEYNKASVVLLRNYAIFFVVVSMAALIVRTRTREKNGE